MWLEYKIGYWDFKVLFSALPLLHSSLIKIFSFLIPVLPISVEIEILRKFLPYQFIEENRV